MSEQLQDLPSSNPNLTEITRRNIDVLHYPSVDILVNNDADLAAWAPLLTEEFKEGLPADWEELSDKKKIFTKMLAEQRFIAKTRTRRNPRDLSILHGPSSVNAFNSVFNELTLAPLVRRVLEEEPVQTAVKSAGFQKLEFIEPIIAVLDRATGDKIVVYEYAPGEPRITKIIRSTTDGTVERGQALERSLTMVRFLREQLKSAGIQPSDLNDRQLLDDSSGTLRLIDIEGYHRIAND